VSICGVFASNGASSISESKFRVLEVVMATKATRATDSGETEIVLQVGTELRITNQGEVILSNPELELARDARAADATLRYRFDAGAGEHIFRLVEPLADHAHTKTHRPND
jgi:hypothetical protein